MRSLARGTNSEALARSPWAATGDAGGGEGEAGAMAEVDGLPSDSSSRHSRL